MPNLVNWYLQQTTTNCLKYDEYQYITLQQLDQFLADYNKLNFVTRIFNNTYKLGYYIYGSVGCGKSMIMNTMFQLTTTSRKLRLNFHEFMQTIHQQLATAAQDPLVHIAKQLKSSYDIIYLDELHVSDIATAMIIQGLFNALFSHKVYLICTSNYHPADLWPDGLMRERFLPAINLLKERLHLLNLNSPHDYRLINNSANQLFIISQGAAWSQLNQIFRRYNSDNHAIKPNAAIEICQRKIQTIQYSRNIIWFDFNVICGPMRSSLDYLELASLFNWFIISNISPLTAAEKDTARRFTWLIDILYDNNCKLALSSAVQIQDIYCAGDFAAEFTRTVSRLAEMQTEEYLQKNLTVKAC